MAKLSNIKKTKLNRELSNIISMYIVIVIFLTLSILLGLILDTILKTVVVFTIVFGLFSLLQVLFGLSVVEKIIIRLMSLKSYDKTIDAEIKVAKDLLNELKSYLNIQSDIELMPINSPSINTLSVGRGEHTHTICITSGALKKLQTEELKALLLHELYHIIHKDTDYLTTVSGTFGSPMLIYKLSHEKITKLRKVWNEGKINKRKIANGIVLHSTIMLVSTLFIPLSFLSNVFVSVRKEFDADLFAAKILGKEVMIKLLSKAVENCYKFDTEFSFIRYHFFVDPNCTDAQGKINFISGTYPSIEERINHLENTLM